MTLSGHSDRRTGLHLHPALAVSLAIGRFGRTFFAALATGFAVSVMLSPDAFANRTKGCFPP